MLRDFCKLVDPRLVLALAVWMAPSPASAASPGPDAESKPSPVSFAGEIEPIFRRNCYGCHQNAKQLGSYTMTDYSALLSGGETGEPAIVAGKPDESYLLEQITPVDGHAEMPDEPFPALSDVEVDLVRRWIAEGAVNDSIEDDAPRFSHDRPPVYFAAPTLPSIDVSPDGSTIAVAGYHEVILFDRDSGNRTARLVGMSPRINQVRFSPDGQRLAACGGNPGEQGELQVWKVNDHALLLSLPMTYDTLSGVSWSPDGTLLALGANDNTMRAVDASTGEQVLFQGAHEDWVRDTGFTADGKHLISVARDMSCKLTEVETERFVDNITSITPGALSGGLSSVAVHPERDEIVVGGADGIAKVYRVFRQTERRIGDDANLIQVMPKLAGRIFSAAISPDGSHIAAVATIDGQSELAVWAYDFDGTVTDELKKILQKRVNDRSAKEKEIVDKIRNRKITEKFRLTFDDAASYSLSFAPDNTLVVAADDGTIRCLSAAGKVDREIQVAEIQPPQARGESDLSLATYLEHQTLQAETESTARLPDLSSCRNLRVEPEILEINSPYQYAQLLVTAELRDGSTLDVTRAVNIELPDWLTLSPRGRLRSTADGKTSLHVRLGSLSQTISVVSSGVGSLANSAQNPDPSIGHVDFIRDVNPVLSRLGCNQGTCHGAQKGKNGFRLSLRGYDPMFDIRALTDDLAARRINAADPSASMMLRKPLGITPHQGGTLMAKGDPYHAILQRWIADGSELNLATAKVAELTISPTNPTAQQIGDQQQVRIVAKYADGTSRDVTGEAFIESGNTEVASVDPLGLLTSVRRGEAPILARYEGAYAATTLTVMGDRSGYQEPVVETWNRIDELVAQKWSRVKVTPSELCDDATFLRRVYLDLTGLPPSSNEVRNFLNDETETRLKRATIVDQLIGSEAYIEYWTNKWADLLQVNRKFLGVEGSVQFRDWIRQSVASNKPYDQFAREILTATGSNNDNPPASYFKTLRTPEDTMENTTHLFLGIRFNCNKCHDHPFERWTQDQYYEMASFFARTELKPDPASGKRKVGGTAVEGAKPLFEKVVDGDKGEVMHPRTGKPVEPTFPVDVPHETSEDATRRERLASWITDPDNPYFALSYANRLWGYLMGVGLIEPLDDIRAGNPPTNPELLKHLTSSLVQSNFDVATLLREICNSRSYQLSVQTQPLNEDDGLNYSHALPRRLPAEVIYDSVHAVTGTVSVFPGVARGTRAAALSDSGVKLADGFLQNLGRPVRESACECERSSELQLGPVMALISGPTIGSAIADPKNELEQIVAEAKTDHEVAEEVFLRALGRFPTEAEQSAFASLTEMIQQDHLSIESQWKAAEEAWQQRRPKLEQKRETNLQSLVAKIEQHKLDIAPERAKLEADRQARVKTAEAAVAKQRETIGEKAAKWIADQNKEVEWYPLAARKLSATVGGGKKTTLTPMPDRSIVATGDAEKATYQLEFQTQLRGITGIRIEALADPNLPENGPGRGGNGNFVLTELSLIAQSLEPKSEPSSIVIADGKADFMQQGFDIKKVFDGNTRDQGGWAVSGATGVDHWATLKLAKPIDHEAGTLLKVTLDQYHKAGNHRLGRFRISVTTQQGDLPLSLPESLASVVAVDVKVRSESANKTLEDYVATIDPELQKANESLATAQCPIPADQVLAGMESRRKQLSEPTPDDPALVELRLNHEQSKKQLKQIRLTAAEDLTWALVNSPAFLFNH